MEFNCKLGTVVSAVLLLHFEFLMIHGSTDAGFNAGAHISDYYLIACTYSEHIQFLTPFWLINVGANRRTVTLVHFDSSVYLDKKVKFVSLDKLEFGRRSLGEI